MLSELLEDDCTSEKVAAKPAAKKKRKAPVPMTELETAQQELKFMQAKLNSACRGNGMLLEELKYVVGLMAEATGMPGYEVMAAIRDRSLTVTHEEV